MPVQTFFLAYASSAAVPFPAQQPIELLGVSRTNNARAGVSGMLLYRGGNFLQVLEGPESIVNDTMLRFSRDHRHRSIMPLCDGFHAERLFAEWSMGFEDVTGRNPSELRGLNAYLSPPKEVEAGARQADHDVFEFFRALRDHMR